MSQSIRGSIEYIPDSEFDDADPVDVEYIVIPGTPDVRYLPNGDPGYPGDPPECQILSIARHGQPVELSDEEVYKVMEACYEDANDREADRGC